MVLAAEASFPTLSCGYGLRLCNRYMAPEVFRHEPYNNKVDVYGEMLAVPLFAHDLA